MSIGAAVGISNLVRTYSNLNNLDMLSRQAKSANSGGTNNNFLFADSMLDGIGDRDGQQKWGQKWLDSYRTVLIQRSQTMQRKLNNMYTRQLGNNLTKKIADNPNYSMASLPRMDTKEGNQIDRKEGYDESLFSMDATPWSAAGGDSRNDQDPVSYRYGKPAIGSLGDLFDGGSWNALTRGGDYNAGNKSGDWGDWASRQYNDPEVKFMFPWEHIEDYFLILNPLSDPLPPLPSVPLLPPFVYFDIMGFATSFLTPIFYPMFFYRFETFAHSEAENASMDASVLRSDYNFKTKGLGQFPIIGQLLGGVTGALTAMVAGASGMGESAIASALDLLVNEQTAVMAPQATETETGAFFATTQALQDWDLEGMDYEYYSATSYVQDFIDTDFLAGFRKAGVELLKTIITTILTKIPPLLVLFNPPLSLIVNPLLTFICENLIKSLLGPIRGQVELDTSETLKGAGQTGSSNGSSQHIGDPGGLFGLTDSAWEAGGFAAGYNKMGANDDDTPLNEVKVLTKRKVLSNLWDGRGVADVNTLTEDTFKGVSSRLTNVGYNTNEPLNLAKFRTNINAMASSNAANAAGYYDRTEDYKMSVQTKALQTLSMGSRRLNPSFGGGIKITDLDTNWEDSFHAGSAAFLPEAGANNRLTISGANFVAGNNGVTSAGAPVMPAPTTPNTNGYNYGNMGSVTFDAASTATNAYVFQGLPGSALQVRYSGPDCLTGPTNAQPQNVEQSRMAENYRVLDGFGNPITAEVVTDTVPIRITHTNPNPGAIPAYEWIIAPTADGDATVGDDKFSDNGTLNMSLGPRVEAMTPMAVVVPVDPNNFGAGGPGTNITTLQFMPTNAVALLAGQIPGGYTAPVNGVWAPWRFTPGSANDNNRDGANAGQTNGAFAGNFPGFGTFNSIETPDARREALMTFNQLIQQHVPSTFAEKQQVNTGNNSAAPPEKYVQDDWNIRMAQYGGHTAAPPGMPPFVPGGGFAANANPFFWQSGGYQYVANWTNNSPADRDGNGMPTASAKVMSVMRLQNGGNQIEVMPGNAADAGRMQPVLMHRGSSMLSMDDDTALGANSKVLQTLAHLRSLGYSQGRDGNDRGIDDGADGTMNGAGPAREYFYNMGLQPNPPAGMPQPAPPIPVGTPGDFTVVKREWDAAGNPKPGGQVTISFTRNYDGITTVPPSSDLAGNPKEDWGAVNGWAITSVVDQTGYSGGLAPGARKLSLDGTADPSGLKKMLWSIEDFSNRKGYAAVSAPMGWAGAGPVGPDNATFVPSDYLMDPLMLTGAADTANVGTTFNLLTVPPGGINIYVSADDASSVFVNGEYFGGSEGATYSMINIPANKLRPGQNFITATIIDRGGPGGMALKAFRTDNGAQIVSTSPAGNWQCLTTPNIQKPDTVTIDKQFTFTPPTVTPPQTVTGDVFPGGYMDINVQGANIGTPKTGAWPYSPATTLQVLDGMANAVSFIPDDFTINIFNDKYPGGTAAAGINIPLVEKDSQNDRYVVLNEDNNNNWNLDGGEDYDGDAKLSQRKGSGTYHIPTDFLDAGNNTVRITAVKGGVFHRFCMNEPPVPQPNDIIDLAGPGPANAGYWIANNNLEDPSTGTTIIPVGSLMYGSTLVSGPAGFGVNGSGIIESFGIRVTPTMFAYRPDSLVSRAGLFDGGWTQGYQMKTFDGLPNIKQGITLSGGALEKPIETFEKKVVDRYVYDPNTQTIQDVFPSKQPTAGPPATAGGPEAGSETRNPLWVGPAGAPVRNTKEPKLFSGTGTTINNAGGAQAIGGQSVLGKAPVGTKVDRADRQTFGSDDNQLTRTLYAAMKVVDLDGTGAMEGDARAYREYRDCFNMGYLDHIYINGSAYSPTGGGFTSFLEWKWKANDVRTKSTTDGLGGHMSAAGTAIYGTIAKNNNNLYMNNYEYFANDADRRARKYTTIRRGDLLMNSFYAFRKEQ